MPLDQFTAMYLDWVNNFLTAEAFAEHYGITPDDADFIIGTGRAINHRELTGSVNA